MICGDCGKKVESPYKEGFAPIYHLDDFLAMRRYEDDSLL